MYFGTFKGRVCAKCPVNQWACDAQYRGSRCEVLRAKAGVDFDPEEVCGLCGDAVYMRGEIHVMKESGAKMMPINRIAYCPMCGRKIGKV